MKKPLAFTSGVGRDLILFEAYAVVAATGVVAARAATAARVWNGVLRIGKPFAEVAAGVVAARAAASNALNNLRVGWCANGGEEGCCKPSPSDLECAHRMGI